MAFCQLVLLGVRTGLARRLSNRRRGNVLLVGASCGQVDPLLTGAALDPWPPYHADGGNAPHKRFPKAVKFGGWPPTNLTWVV